MLELKQKEDCSGCAACASICPQQCIEMREDIEGFMYPFVNKEKCVDCNLCVEKCPIVGKEKVKFKAGMPMKDVIHEAVMSTENLPDSYVCFIKNREIRDKSTSGGVFSALANFVIESGGVVFGAKINKNQEIVHTYVERKEELDVLRGSKYVQSDQGNIYCIIKEKLNENRLVLYSGTPCQVEGLKLFLGKGYENLITIDIFCHGVGSPLYWRKYINYMEGCYKSKIRCVYFREKTYGYNSATLALYFENGKSSHKGHDDDLYWSPFSKNIIHRPSCYSCVFKKINHISDFSIGDFWNTKQLPADFSEAEGCSLILCHSKKGKDVLKKIQRKISFVSIDLEEALTINGGHQPSMLIASPQCPNIREKVFADMYKMKPDKLNKKYIPINVKQKIKILIKPVLYRIGILKRIKRFGDKNVT